MEELTSAEMFQGISPALLEAICARMDPEDALNAVNFFPESAQRFPGKIRCFCPIHREKVIRTMTIDTNKKRFSCRYARCKGSRGGNLLALYVLGTRCSPAEAVDYWVKRLKIDPSDYLSSAEEAEKTSEETYTIENLLQPQPAPEEEQLPPEQVPEEPTDQEPVPKDEAKEQAVGISLEELLQLDQEKRKPGSREEGAQQPYARGESTSKPGSLLEELTSASLRQMVDRAETLGGKEQAIAVLQDAVDRARVSVDVQALKALAEILESDYPDQIPLRQTVAYSLLENDVLEQGEAFSLSTMQFARDKDDWAGAIQTAETVFQYLCRSTAFMEFLAQAYVSVGEGTKASDTYTKLADLYSQADLQGKSVEAYRSALKHAPTNIEIRQKLADFCLDRGMVSDAIDEFNAVGDLLLSDDKQDESERVFRKILEIDTSNTEALQKLVVLYRRRGEREKLETTYLNLGAIFEKQGVIGRAIKVYEGALRCVPESVPLLERLAQAHADKGDDKEACQAYEHLLSLVPDHAQAKQFLAEQSPHTPAGAVAEGVTPARDSLVRARQASDKGEWESAEQILLETLTLDSDNVEARIALGSVYASSSRPVDAIKTLMLVKAVGEESRTAREKLIEVGRNVLAAEQFPPGDLPREDVVEIVLQSCCELAQDYQRSGLHGKATQILSLGRELAPAEPRLLEQLGDIYAEAGSVDRLGEVAEQLADLYRQRGELENVGDTYERLLRVDPGNLLALERLVEWERERGSLIGRFQMALSFAGALSSKGLVGRAAEVYRQARTLDLDSLPSLSEDDVHTALQRILQITDKLAALNKARGEVREITLDRTRLAEQLAEKQFHEQAAALASEVVQDAPQEVSAWSVLASSCRALKQTKRALECYTKLAELLDTDIALTDKDSIKRAQEAYQSILELDDQSLWAEENLARLLSRSGQQSESLSLLKTLLEKAQKAGDVSRVVSAAKLITTLDPNDRNCLTVLKDTLAQRGDVAGALQALDKLVMLTQRERVEEEVPSSDLLSLLQQRIQLAPDQSEYLIAFADALAQVGEVDKAAEQWKAVGEMCVSQGRTDLAEKAFEKQIELCPNSVETHEAYGEMLRTSGRVHDSARIYAIAAHLRLQSNGITEALRNVRTALQADPWSAEAMHVALCLAQQGTIPENEIDRWAEQCVQLAERYARQKDHQQALDLLNKLLSVVPNHRSASLLYAEVLSDTGKVDEAARAYISLGEQTRSEKIFLEAVEHFKRAVSLIPSDPKSHLSLGDVLCEVGNRDAAVEHWSTGLDLLLEAQQWEQALTATLAIGSQARNHLTLKRKIVQTLTRIQRDWSGAKTSSQVGEALHDEQLNLLALLGEDISRPEVSEEICDIASRILEEDESCAPAWEWSARAAGTNDPKRPSYLLKAAHLYHKLKESGKAQSLAMEVSSIPSLGAADRESLVLLLYDIGDKEQAHREQVKLAESLLEQGDLDSALHHFEKLLESDPANTPIRERLFELNVKSNRQEYARETAQRLSEYWEHESNLLQAIAWQKKVVLIEREHEDGQELIEKALAGLDQEQRRQRITHIIRLADLLQSAGVHAERKALLTHCANILHQQKDSESALTLLKSLSKEYPNEPQILEQLGTLLAEVGTFSEALEVQTKAASLYRLSSQLDDAARCYRKAAQSTGKEAPELVLKTWRELAEMYLSVGRINEVISVCREAVETLAKLDLQQQMQDLLKAVAEQSPQGGQILESLVGWFRDNDQQQQALWCSLQAAQFYATHQWFSKAQQIYQTLVEQEPSRTEAAVQLAQMYKQRGMQAEVADFCLQVFHKARSAELEVAVQKFYLDLAHENQPDSAAVLKASVVFHETALSASKSKKDQQTIRKDLISVQCRLAEYLLSENDLESASEHVQAALMLDAKDAQASTLAERIEKRAAEKAPTEAALDSIRKVEELVSEKKFKEAVALLESLLKADPYNLRVTLALCDALAALGKQAEAFDLVQRQGQHFIAENLLPSAQKCLERCCKLRPEEAQSHQRLAEVLARLGHRDDAIKEYALVIEQAEKSDSPSVSLAACQAALALEPNNMLIGEKHAALLQASGEDEPARQQWLTLGQLAREQGSEESRVAYLEKALSLWGTAIEIEERAQIQQDLARTFLGLGQLDKAAELLDQSVELARSAQHWETVAKGIETVLADERVPSSLRNKQGLQWLVEAYEKTEDIEKASRVWRQLAHLLGEQGDAQGALTAYRGLLALKPGDLGALEDSCRIALETEQGEETVKLHQEFFRALQEAGLLAKAEQTAQTLLKTQQILLEKQEGVSGKSHAQQISQTVAVLASVLKERGRDHAIPAVVSGVARTLGQNNCFDECIEILQIALAEDPDHVECLVLLAEALETTKAEKQSAQVHAKLASILDSERLLAEKDNRKIVLNAYGVLARLEPKEPQWCESLARVCVLDDNKEQACLWLRTALDRTKTDDQEKRLRILRQIIALDPKNLLALEEAANLEASQANSEQAIALFQQVNVLLSAGDQDETSIAKRLDILRRILQIAPDRLEERLVLAQTLATRSEKDQAVGEYLKAANAYRQRGQIPQAIECCQQALVVDESVRDIRRMLAELLAATGQRTEAVAQHLSLARKEEDEGNLEQAETEYRAVLDMDTWDVTALLKLSVIAHNATAAEKSEWLLRISQLAARCCENQDYEQARQLYTQALTINPEDTMLLEGLSHVLEQAGEIQESIAARMNLADLHIKQGRRTEATSCYRDILRAAPDDSQLTLVLARKFEECGDVQDSVDAFIKVGTIHTRQSEWTDASKAFSEAVRLAPRSLEAHKLLLEALEHVNDTSNEGASRIQETRLNLITLLRTQESSPKVLRQIREVCAALLRENPKNERALRSMADSWADEDESKRIRLLLNLADVYLEKAEPDRAVSVVRELQSTLSLGMEDRRKVIALLEKANLRAEVLRESESLIDLLFANEREEEAINELLSLLKKYPEQIPSRIRLHDALRDMGNSSAARGQALRIAEHFAAQDDLSSSCIWIEAALLAQQPVGEVRDVAQFLEKRRFSSEEEDLAIRLAEVYARLGKQDKAQQALLALGEALEDSEHYDRAIEVLEQAAAQQDENPRAWESLARLYGRQLIRDKSSEMAIRLARYFRKRGVRHEAEKWYHEALSSVASLPIQQEFAELLWSTGSRQSALDEVCKVAESLSHTNQPTEAVALVTRFLAEDANNTRLLLVLAGLHEQMGNRQEQVQVLVQAAESWREKEFLSKAQSVYQQIIQIDPLHEQTYDALAAIHLERGMESEAVKQYLTLAEQLKRPDAADTEGARLQKVLTRVLELDAHNTTALKSLADLYEGQTETKNKNKAKEARERLSEVLGRLVPALLRQNDLDGACAFLEQLRALSPKDPLVGKLDEEIQGRRTAVLPQEALLKMVAQAKQFAAEGNIPQAVQQYEELLDSEPMYLAAIIGLGDALMVLQQSDRAARLFEEKGLSFLESGLIPQAQNCLERCCAISLDNLNAHRALAKAFSIQGMRPRAVEILLHIALIVESQDIEQAIQILREAESLVPDQMDLRVRIAGLLGRAERFEESRREYSLAIDSYEQSGRPDLAASAIEALLQHACPSETEQRLALQLRLARRLFDLDRSERASKVALEIGDSAFESGHWELARQAFELLFSVAQVEPAYRSMANREKLAQAQQHVGAVQKASDQYNIIAEESIGKGDMQRAFSAYQKVFALNPEDLAALERLFELTLQLNEEALGVEYGLQLSRSLAARGLLGKAESTYHQMLNLEQRREQFSSDVYEAAASFFLDKGDSDKAVGCLLELAGRYEQKHQIAEQEAVYASILSLSLDSPKAHLACQLLARLQESQGNPEKALATYQRLAEIHRAKENLSDFIDVFRHVLRLEPHEESHYQNMAQAYLHLRQTPEAVDFFERTQADAATAHDWQTALLAVRQLIQIRHEWEPYREQEIQIVHTLGRPDEAIQCALESAEDFFKKGAPEEATQVLEALLELIPDQPTVRSRLEEIRGQLDSDKRQQDTQQSLQEATRLENQGNLVGAIAAYEKAIRSGVSTFSTQESLARLYSESARSGVMEHAEKAIDLYTQLAQQAQRSHQFEVACAHLRKACAVDPERVGILSALAKAYSDASDSERAASTYLKVADIYQAQGLLDSLEDVYRKILTLEPDNLSIRGRLGTLLADRNSVEDAVEQFWMQALEYENREVVPRAIGALQRILTLKPEHLPARRRLVQLYLQKGDARASLEQQREVIRMLLLAGKPDEAIQECRTALELEPGNLLMREELADLYAQLGRSKDALQQRLEMLQICREKELVGPILDICEAILKDHPDRTDVSDRLVQTLLDGGQTAKAIQECRRLAGLVEKQLPEDAIKRYKMILEITPDDLHAHQGLIRVYRRQNQKEQAFEHLVAAGNLLLQQRHYHKAAQAFWQAIQIEPRDEEVYRHLAFCQEKLGEPKHAWNTLESRADVLAKSGKTREAVEEYLRLADLYLQESAAD